MKSSKGTIRAIFAGNVKKYRKMLKYSQEKLAEKADISVQAVRDIEIGRSWVSDRTVYVLAKALNIEEFQLFLTEKHTRNKRYGNKSLKSLKAIQDKLENYLKEQFEKAVNSGDFT